MSTARRGLAAAGDIEAFGELRALPGYAGDVLAPRALLLAAFDTVMLGYRSRSPVVAASDDRQVLPGGGMLRPVVLIDGQAAGTWTVARSTVTIRWFRRPAESAELDAERADVARFLA